MPRLMYTQAFGILICLAFGIAAASLHHPQRVLPALGQGDPLGGEGASPYSLTAGEARPETAPRPGEAEEAGAAGGPIQLKPDDYQDDWRQAGAGEGMLGDQLRSHRVRLVNGKLHGRMITFDPQTGRDIDARNMTVYFLQKGSVVAAATLNPQGRFSVEGLAPGVYGLVAAGPDGFAAYSLHVLGDPLPGAQAGGPVVIRPVSYFQEEKLSLEIQTLVVPRGNFGALKSLILNHVPDRVVTVNWLEPDAGIAAGAKTFEVEQRPGALPAGPGGLYHRETLDKEAFPATSIRGHTVRLQPDGTLIGRVRRLHPAKGRPLRPGRINVFLLRHDRVAAQAPVETSGVFAIPKFAPGVYSLVAVSRETAAVGFEGFAAFSINVLPSPKPAATAGGQTPVALASLTQGEGGLEIDFSLIEYENLAALKGIAGAELPGGLEGGLGGVPGGALGGGPAAPGGGPAGEGAAGGEGGAVAGAGAEGAGGGGGGAGGGGGGGGGFAGGPAGLMAGAAGIAGASLIATEDEETLQSPFLP